MAAGNAVVNMDTNFHPPTPAAETHGDADAGKQVPASQHSATGSSHIHHEISKNLLADPPSFPTSTALNVDKEVPSNCNKTSIDSQNTGSPSAVTSAKQGDVPQCSSSECDDIDVSIPTAVPAPPRVRGNSDVSQFTRKKLQELLKHQLIIPGPDQLTVDVCGMRFFANINERGIITTLDHPLPFNDLNELCIYCSGDSTLQYDNLYDGGDSAGWLLVKHNNRPLVALMSALASRKARLKQSTSTRVHFSIFDDVPIVRGTRERKRVEKFTYEPRVKKRQRGDSESDGAPVETDSTAPGKPKRPVGRPPKGGHPKTVTKAGTKGCTKQKRSSLNAMASTGIKSEPVSDMDDDTEDDDETEDDGEDDDGEGDDADDDDDDDDDADDDGDEEDDDDEEDEVLTARASAGSSFEERKRKGSDKKIFFSNDVPERDTTSNKSNPVWCIPCQRSLAGRSSFRRHLKDFHHMTSLKAKKIPVHFLCQSDGSPNSEIPPKKGGKTALPRGNTSDGHVKKERVDKQKKGPRQYVPLALVPSAEHTRKQDELYDAFLKFFFSDGSTTESATPQNGNVGEAGAIASGDVTAQTHQDPSSTQQRPTTGTPNITPPATTPPHTDRTAVTLGTGNARAEGVCDTRDGPFAAATTAADTAMVRGDGAAVRRATPPPQGTALPVEEESVLSSMSASPRHVNGRFRRGAEATGEATGPSAATPTTAAQSPRTATTLVNIVTGTHVTSTVDAAADSASTTAAPVGVPPDEADTHGRAGSPNGVGPATANTVVLAGTAEGGADSNSDDLTNQRTANTSSSGTERSADAADAVSGVRAPAMAHPTEPREEDGGSVTVGVIEVLDVSDARAQLGNAHVAVARRNGAATSSVTRGTGGAVGDTNGSTTTGDITAMDTDASGTTTTTTTSSTAATAARGMTPTDATTTSLALAAALEKQQQPKRELRRYRPTKMGAALLSGHKQVSPFTMLPCQQFNESRMRQPFRVQVTCSALFLMDLHSHLATTEVIGYLAGYWDATTKSITVTKAFPCRALEPGEGQGREQTVEMDPESEIETRAAISKRGMVVVGWYHSHPVFIAEPSIRDIENQTSYQTLFREGSDEPFVGFIIAPYEASATTTETSLVRCFWISETHKHCSHGSPMAPVYDVIDDVLDVDVCGDIRSLVRYYEVYTDRVFMSDSWRNRCSKKIKLAASLRARLPARLAPDKGTRILQYIIDALALSDRLHEKALAVQRAKQGDSAQGPPKKASKKQS